MGGRHFIIGYIDDINSNSSLYTCQERREGEREGGREGTYLVADRGAR